MQDEIKKRFRLRLIGFLLFLFFFIITISAVTESILEFIEARRYSPEGKLYSLDGYLLHLNCSGSGSPTIILESDLTYPAKQWLLVQKALSNSNRVCSYDRAGMGWSTPNPYPRTGEEMTQELYHLIKKANLEDSFILVGFRRGTWLARLFAYSYPDFVKGVVLIEPIPDQPSDRLLPYEKLIYEKPLYYYRLMPLVSWLGITRAIENTSTMKWFTDPFQILPIEVQKEIFALTIYKPKYWQHAAAEMSLSNSIEQELKNRGDLKNIPLVILVNSSPTVISGSTAEAGPIHNLYQQMQSSLAERSSQSLVLECSTCGTMPPITAAPEVVQAIQQIFTFYKP